MPGEGGAPGSEIDKRAYNTGNIETHVVQDGVQRTKVPGGDTRRGIEEREVHIGTIQRLVFGVCQITPVRRFEGRKRSKARIGAIISNIIVKVPRRISAGAASFRGSRIDGENAGIGGIGNRRNRLENGMDRRSTGRTHPIEKRVQIITAYASLELSWGANLKKSEKNKNRQQ